MLSLPNESDDRPSVCAAFALAAVASVFVLGCGGKSKTVSVQGAITYQGKEVSSGLINFMPATGRPLGGPIGTDGTYSVSLPPGEYQVRIDAPAPMPADWKEGMPAPKLGPPLVPEKYAKFDTSGLTAKIGDEKSQQVDFKLP